MISSPRGGFGEGFERRRYFSLDQIRQHSAPLNVVALGMMGQIRKVADHTTTLWTLAAANQSRKSTALGRRVVKGNLLPVRNVAQGKEFDPTGNGSDTSVGIAGVIDVVIDLPRGSHKILMTHLQSVGQIVKGAHVTHITLKL
jgi:hypothetical protein